MRKNFIILFISIVSIIFSICLCYFVLPEQIPILFDFKEQTIFLSSKWILVCFWISTGITCALNFKFNQVFQNKFFLSVNLALIFINIFFTLTLSFSIGFEIGNPLEIPLSTIFGLPISFVLVSLPYSFKGTKFKSKFGIRNKYSLENEFLWCQTHIIAYEKLKPICLLLFFVTLILAPFRLFYVEISLFVITIFITFIIIIHKSKIIYLKYKQMEARKNKLNSAKE